MATALYAKSVPMRAAHPRCPLTGILAKELSRPLGYTGFPLHLFVQHPAFRLCVYPGLFYADL